VSTPTLLDASCILAWAFGEPGADKVEAVLPVAYITAVNLTEVVHALERRGDEGVELAADLIALGPCSGSFWLATHDCAPPCASGTGTSKYPQKAFSW
jgi:hypothetical protein